jgi:co-chaperonin GroES (HSP10)
MLRPIGDSIIFIFEDDVDEKGFTNKTSGGLIYKSFDVDVKSPRWGKVISVGDKVEEIQPGMTVLIEPLRWTDGFKHEDVKYWKTVEKEIMAIREE